jgi:hypothetical protein
MILCLAIELALFDSTKRFVYWVVVVPYLCVALADMALWAWQRATDLDERRRFVVRAAMVGVAALFLLEGLAVAAGDVRDARDAPDYAALGRELREVLPADAVVLGDNRLWPALDDWQLRGLLLLFYHTNPDISEERTTSVTGALDRIGADYVLLSPHSREMLDHLTPRDKAEFERFIAERTKLVDTVEDRAYGRIDVYRVRR